MNVISPITFIDKLIKKNELGQPFSRDDRCCPRQRGTQHASVKVNVFDRITVAGTGKSNFGYSYFLRFLRLGYRPNLDVHVGLIDLARCNPELALRAIMEFEPGSCPEILIAEIAVPRLNLDPFRWPCRHSPPSLTSPGSSLLPFL
jgi:hypothetical protein